MENVFGIRDKVTGELMTATDEMNAAVIYLQTIISNDFKTNVLTPHSMLLT
jgi:hypothetical protein